MSESLLPLSRDEIAAFCRKNRIRKLSVFGSALRDDYGPESDLDVLVEFEPDARVGLIRLAGIEHELSQMVRRKVDLNTPGFLSPYFRDRVISESRVEYVAA